jgi:hypothetical protein
VNTRMLPTPLQRPDNRLYGDRRPFLADSGLTAFARH